MSEQEQSYPTPDKANKSAGVLKKMDKKLGEIRESGVTFPSGYDPSRAIWEAYLTLQDVTDKSSNKALEVCKESSVAMSLTKMVLKGLNPSANHCGFVVYGDRLELVEQYEGTIARASREAGLVDVKANLVYEGDEFDYNIDPATGRLVIEKHKQSLGNVSPDNIIAVYAFLHFSGRPPHVELMTFEEVRRSWAQRQGGKESPAHTKFPGEMAKKTVISRALKHYVDGLSAAGEEAYKAISREAEREEVENKPLTAPPEAPETESGSFENDKPF